MVGYASFLGVVELSANHFPLGTVGWIYAETHSGMISVSGFASICMNCLMPDASLVKHLLIVGSSTNDVRSFVVSHRDSGCFGILTSWNLKHQPVHSPLTLIAWADLTAKPAAAERQQPRQRLSTVHGADVIGLLKRSH